ncbi:class I SAM-dependent methyltransferase [Alicyclobacillus sp. ALC3]|uniref:class I SAM-dependent methyltransferase n=1 Tax=Alicyclobacillus sp. ALC3 TaxID=2796143 RepID=UPI002379AE4C|nr:class I SAM-dependent methyltransferase [Alicyclobacillus sp. ALC3]WDL97194.1 class I SAM-dependent methyltransferase [Alicyclobacillus sp. ALC3]
MADETGATLSSNMSMKMMAEGLKQSSLTQDVTQSPIFKEVMVNLGDKRTVLDIGAGVGRYTAPLASAGCKVTAIEPSPEMISHLRETLARYEVSEVVNIVQASWPQDNLKSAEVTLASFVIQFSNDWVGFARAMEKSATNRCILAVHVDPIMYFMDKLWPIFHAEEPGPRMPGFTEIYPVLLEAGIIANVKVFEEQHGPRWKNAEEALPTISERLGVVGNREAMKQLEDILEDPTFGIFATRAHRVAMISWKPSTPA